VKTLDELLTPYLDRRVEELSQVEKAILRLGAFELKERQDVPYRVVINEGIELAKVFGAEDSFKYVNGVLDKLARQLRYAEASERRSRD
jgi:N utilization substance protein B